MGGYPALGFDIKDRQLLVNKAEAITVRRIFQRFTELRSITEGLSRNGARGDHHEGVDDSRGQGTSRNADGQEDLSKALRNPLYVGEIRHKGAVYAGQHEAIITRQLWDRCRPFSLRMRTRAWARQNARQDRRAAARTALWHERGKISTRHLPKPSGKR